MKAIIKAYDQFSDSISMAADLPLLFFRLILAYGFYNPAMMKLKDINAIGEKHVTGDLSVGDMLLNRCADEGIDMLVMGAFTQYRRGNQMLGEVGRYLLKYMTVPVLMSH